MPQPQDVLNFGVTTVVVVSVIAATIIVLIIAQFYLTRQPKTVSSQWLPLILMITLCLIVIGIAIVVGTVMSSQATKLPNTSSIDYPICALCLVL